MGIVPMLPRSRHALIPACFYSFLSPLKALPLVIKVLAKTMDTSLSPDKVELATLTRDAATGKVGRGWQQGREARSGGKGRELNGRSSESCKSSPSGRPSSRLPRTSACSQVTFKIFEAAEMKPLLEIANAEKEKDADAAR